MHTSAPALARIAGLSLALLSAAQVAALASDIFASAAPSPGANGLYRIDSTTGVPTLVASMPLIAGLAGTPDGRLVGWTAGALVEVDTTTGLVTPVGSSAGVTATGFEVLSDGRAFIVGSPQTLNAQLFQVDLATGQVTPVGPAGAINAGIDASLGLTPGTSRANIFSLGSIGTNLYGINGETGRLNLVRIDTATAATTVIGPINALANANGGGWGGFASLTGVDTDLDGTHDALFGGVNFAPGGARAGVVARFDPLAGTWTQVSANPPLIFFGMGSIPGVTCDGLDFNNDGIENDPTDIEAFLSIYSGGPCVPTSATCNDIDFNNDGIDNDPTDIESFLSVYSGGPCF